MIAGFLALMTAASAAPPAAIGELRLFGDWIVGCDNGLSCEAMSLDPEDAIGTAPGALTVTREGGAHGRPRLALRMMEEVTGDTVSLRIDGGHAASATRSPGGELFLFDPGMARVILPMIAEGRRATVIGATGEEIGAISLAGSSAAMRYIDDRQARAGTRGALVARGRDPDSGIPEPPAIPEIVAMPAPGAEEGPATGLTDAAAQEIRERHDCFEDRPRRNEAIRVSHTATLVLVSCGGGAYNFSDFAFIVEDGETRPARFDAPVGWGEEISPALLVNAWWNASAGTLDTYAKGRGIGDCGTAQRFVWDGEMFRLVEQRQMNQCRGSLYWLTVYRANPAWTEP